MLSDRAEIDGFTITQRHYDIIIQQSKKNSKRENKPQISPRL